MNVRSIGDFNPFWKDDDGRSDVKKEKEKTEGFSV